jgi:hypothetical protein
MDEQHFAGVSNSKERFQSFKVNGKSDGEAQLWPLLLTCGTCETFGTCETYLFKNHITHPATSTPPMNQAKQ